MEEVDVQEQRGNSRMVGSGWTINGLNARPRRFWFALRAEEDPGDMSGNGQHSCDAVICDWSARSAEIIAILQRDPLSSHLSILCSCSSPICIIYLYLSSWVSSFSLSQHAGNWQGWSDAVRNNSDGTSEDSLSSYY